MVSTFAELGLSEATLNAISELDYEEPTPIQEQTVHLMLEGADVIAQAPTGTGKIGASALPVSEKLDANIQAPQALVLTPTRELAMQVAEAFHPYGKYARTSVLLVYGGQPIERQLRALKQGVQVVVARHNVRRGDDVAVMVGHGQDVGRFGAFAALVGHRFAAFLGDGMVAIQVQDRQAQVAPDGVDTVLPPPFETAIPAPFAEMVIDRIQADFFF